MTEREELIKLLDEADLFLRNRADSFPAPLNEFDIETLHDIVNICDEVARMLEKAIVPLCKVGDTVYFIENKQVRCGEVLRIEQHKESEFFEENAPIQEVYHVNSAVILFPMGCCETILYNRMDFGETVFLTREEAEEKLKEVDNG